MVRGISHTSSRTHAPGQWRWITFVVFNSNFDTWFSASWVSRNPEINESHVTPYNDIVIFFSRALFRRKCRKIQRENRKSLINSSGQWLLHRGNSASIQKTRNSIIIMVITSKEIEKSLGFRTRHSDDRVLLIFFFNVLLDDSSAR